MKKLFATLLIAVFAVVISACGSVKTSAEYTFKIENGDHIGVKLDTSDGYTLMENGDEFFVTYTLDSDEGEQTHTMVDGSFLLTDGDKWQVVYDDVNGNPDAEIIREETAYGNEYVFVNFADTQYTCCIKLAGCNTGVQIDAASYEALQEGLSHLEFNVKE